VLPLNKIGICGNFGAGINTNNGQTIKSIILKSELAKVIGENQINTVDSYNWKENPLKLFLSCLKLIITSKTIIIMPAHNGLKIFLPLFIVLNIIWKRKIHYVVIGGWLPDYIKEKRYLMKYLKQVDGIHVETLSMMERLKKHGLKRIYYMPNFKRLEYLSEDGLVYPNGLPYKLCTFSRVTKEKGIEEAIIAVTEINKKYNKTVYTLDIYGPLDDNFMERFNQILSNSGSYISYKGIVPYDKSVEILKNYYLLLFPTYYQGEGFAGTLLDSLASGVPIIGSNWRYNSEIIKSGVVGEIYDLNKDGDLIEKLEKAIENPDIILNMKINCLDEYEKYEPSNVISTFLKRINLL
jgi:glycosyltransferase involved in cell wall biosynthesis